MPPENTSTNQQPGKREKSVLGKLVTPFIAILLILVIAALVMRDDPEENDEPRPERAITVDVAPVVAVTLEDTVRGVGTLDPLQTVRIKPEVNGRLTSINFEEGGFVEKNQVLFKIDDEKIARRHDAQKAALESTRIRLENLRRNYDRVSSLRDRDLVSEDQYDNARTELQAVSSEVERLEAQLELAARELRDTVIRAPFDGYISRQLVDPGTFVTVGETLAVIYEIDPIQMSFFIPEKYAGRVERGQDVYASVAAHPDRRFQSKVDFISPVADERTRKFRVRTNIENPENILMPGSFAHAELVLALREDKPVIPEQALVPTREGYIVYVVNDSENNENNGTAEIRHIQTGIRQSGRVEIVDGLSVGEKIVVYGHMQLDEGSAVVISDTWDDDWSEEKGTGHRTAVNSGKAYAQPEIMKGG